MPPFNRDALASSLLSLYGTILRMKGDDATTLYIPPESGWSFDSADEQYLLNTKSPAVFDLMKHLPYCNTHIAHSTDAISYVGSSWYSVHNASNPWPAGVVHVDVQRHELPLTMQHENAGKIVVVDADTGMAKVWGGRWVNSTPECAVHVNHGDDAGGMEGMEGKEKCPLLCRHQIGVPERPAVELFEEWRRKFWELEWMIDARGEIMYPGVGEDDELDVSDCECVLFSCSIYNLYRSKGKR